MKQKRLLYIGNNLQASGATVTTVETLSAQLRSIGFVVTTASSVKNKLGRLFHMLWSVLKNRKEVDYVLIDTYSTQNFYFAVAVGNLCRLLRLPYIPILHGGNLPARLQKSRQQARKLFHSAFMNVAPSMYLYTEFNKEGYTNLVHIPNVIDIAQYPFQLRNPVKAKLLWVRSFAKIYNPKLALEILKDLGDEGIDASLCMVGPDKDGSLKECQEFAKANDLPVRFTGKLEKSDWIQLSKDYDIFINTTNFDNTPVSIMEAMALGLPVISTNVGGMPFLVTHKKEGILLPPNDKNAFVQAIKQYLNEPQEVVAFTKVARKKAESFDWQLVKQQWLSLLKS